MQVVQWPRDYRIKGGNVCGSRGATLNEMLPRSLAWLHGESMAAEFLHRARTPGTISFQRASLGFQADSRG
jgi:hypothetical protein